MNAVKEYYWKPEGEEVKCYTGYLYVNLNSWALKQKNTSSIVNLVLILQDIQENKKNPHHSEIKKITRIFLFYSF